MLRGGCCGITTTPSSKEWYTTVRDSTQNQNQMNKATTIPQTLLILLLFLIIGITAWVTIGNIQHSTHLIAPSSNDPTSNDPKDASLPSLSPPATVILSPTQLLTASVYLPAIFNQTSAFVHDYPIWAHADQPAAHEVVLFRHTFNLDEPLDDAMLVLFADTRYEVWIDGVWTGRGPARFSQATREYDTYQLGTLSPGSHLIAILVQWAPGTRRSESTTPFLLGHIQGETPHGFKLVAGTGSWWDAQQASAWRSDSTPVHAWGLIGPTELLDLRHLPPDWMQPAFAATGWQPATVKDIPGTHYQPRSIPQLANVPIAATIKETGLLSPDAYIGEIRLSPRTTSVLSLSVPLSTEITIETLMVTTTTTTMIDDNVGTEASRIPPLHIDLDGNVLALQHDDQRHPDVRVASQKVLSGTHSLAFTSALSLTWPIVISGTDIQMPTLPITQSTHAGRRLLLSEPVSRSDVVQRLNPTRPDVIITQTPAYVVLDLGRVVHGRLKADVQGPAGNILDIGWDERLWHGSRPLPYPGSFHPQWNQTDSWILDGNNRTISTLDTRAGRYILLAIWGDAPVAIRNIQVYEERASMQQVGWFTSPDPLLNRIWQVGVDTLYANKTDAYADPWRERGQWWGDAFIADHINQVAFGDTLLLRRGLLFMAEGFHDGRPPSLAPGKDGSLLLDYGMLWVQSLDDYWRLTRDSDSLKQVYPVLIDFLDYLAGYEHTTTRLLDIPRGSWMQTALIDWVGDENRYGQSTALNALYYDTLLKSAGIADSMQDPDHATAWRRKAENIKTQANNLLYRANQGRYIASLVGDEIYEPTPQAQAWALTYNLMPDEAQHDVADALIELLSTDPAVPNVEIYGMYWVLEALGRTGRLDDAEVVMKRYYKRLLDLGATTWWETFNANESYTAALSHGWGGSPTWFLSRYGLGVRRTGPQSWEIQPGLHIPGELSGGVPLHDGVLQVRWTYPDTDDTGATGTLTLDAPTTSHGTIVIPRTPGLVLVLNGETIWHHNTAIGKTIFAHDEHLLLFIEDGGSYTFEIK